ncbi:S41 family peptidase [Candidatus Riflebacteria bacterium]
MHIKRSINFSRISILTVFLSCFIFIPLQKIDAGKSRDADQSSQLKMVQRALNLILDNYHKPNIDFQQLLYGAVKGMIKELDDPFSRFMEPEKFKDMEVETQGEFGGLGIVISIRDDILTIIAPIEDTPAYRAGVLAGDKIVKIDGKSTEGMSTQDAVKVLRGLVGTKVTIGIMRKSFKKPKDYVITRAIIKIKSTKARILKNSKGNIGYIRLTNFMKTSASDLEKALNALEKNKIIGLILDLRNNPGGLLNSAVDIARKFLSKGVIVSIRGRDQEPITYSSFYKSHPDIPLVVLINRGSASASEIVAGAIRDNKRGLLLGEKTFGKGSVQTIMQLPNGAAMALTTALYYLPNGETIHKKGINPDIEVKMPELSEKETKKIIADQEKKEKENYKKVNERIQKEKAAIASGTLDPKKKIFFLENLEIPSYDVQLLKAVNILKANHIFTQYNKKETKN